MEYHSQAKLPSGFKDSPVSKKHGSGMSSTSSLSSKKHLASSKGSPTKSPNKITWLRASDEDLLNRLKSIPKSPTREGDKCGSCVSEIVELLQEKLQALLEEKISLRKSKINIEDQLRLLNESHGKIKSELYGTEKYLTKVNASEDRYKEEIHKMEEKIKEVEDQINSIRVHGGKITADENARLENGIEYFEQLKVQIKQSLENEREILNDEIAEEDQLEQILQQRIEEYESLKKAISDFYAKESDRLTEFRSVTNTIEASKGSKILK